MPTLYEHATDPFQYAASGTPRPPPPANNVLAAHHLRGPAIDPGRFL